jgi:hypothetical protein
MNKEMKEVIERLIRVEDKIDRCKFGYPQSHLIDCNIDFGLKLRPLYPLTVSEEIRLQQAEVRLNASIHREIKAIEDKINHYLRYEGI